MTPRDRRPRRAAAVVGLLAGLALLLGAVLDGGLSTPTRTDLREPVAAAPTEDRSAPRLADTREDVPAWGQTVPSSRIAAVVLAGLVALVAMASFGPGTTAIGPRHRAPALLAARHRGPPVVV
jgi:hypothetical protein